MNPGEKKKCVWGGEVDLAKQDTALCITNNLFQVILHTCTMCLKPHLFLIHLPHDCTGTKLFPTVLCILDIFVFK